MLFYIVFFSLYAYMYFYFIYKLKKAFNVKVLKFYLISPLFILSPYFYRMYDKAGYDFYYLSLFILILMGFIILFFIYFALIDFYHILIRIFNKIFGINPLPSIRNNISFVFVLLLTISSLAYGYYETLNPKIYRFVIYSNKIKKDIKILHISDLHLNQVMREDKIKLVLDVYNKEKPDMVISTGDLVDGKVSYRKSYIELQKSMNPPLGKYAILGNHEYYTDINDAVKFHILSKFQLLRNETVSIDNVNVAIIGVDDIDGVRLGYIAEYPEKDLFKGLDKTKFVIFLKHQPKLDKNLIGEFDLMLSGHTHGGVLFPVRYILRKIFIADFGFVNIGGSYVFVSRGVGTGGPPIRIGCPPDVAVFEIKKPPR